MKVYARFIGVGLSCCAMSYLHLNKKLNQVNLKITYIHTCGYGSVIYIGLLCRVDVVTTEGGRVHGSRNELIRREHFMLDLIARYRFD